MSGVGDQSVSASDTTPRVVRVAAEDAFGEQLRSMIASAGAKVTDVARVMGMRREDLYEIFDGQKHMRAAWLSLLPPAVECLYLAARAAHHGMELRPVGDEDAHPRSLHDVITELSDVQRAACEGERDGELSVADIERELAEWRDVDNVMSSRVAHLKRLLSQRGGVVEPLRKVR
jgi:hypothetical protein